MIITINITTSLGNVARVTNGTKKRFENGAYYGDWSDDEIYEHKNIIKKTTKYNVTVLNPTLTDSDCLSCFLQWCHDNKKTYKSKAQLTKTKSDFLNNNFDVKMGMNISNIGSIA